MKKLGISLISLVLIGAVAGSLVFASCTGAEGIEGPQGLAGAQGPQGPVGPGLEPMTRTFDIIMGGVEINGQHEEEGEVEMVGEHEEEGEHEGEVEMVGEHEGEGEALMGEFYRWEPAVLMAFEGDTIILTVTNPGDSAHIFVLPEFGVVTPLLEPLGGTAVMEFTIDKAGIFQFACALPHDHEAGYCGPDHESMVGYFIVLER